MVWLWRDLDGGSRHIAHVNIKRRDALAACHGLPVGWKCSPESGGNSECERSASVPAFGTFTATAVVLCGRNKDGALEESRVITVLSTAVAEQCKALKVPPRCMTPCRTGSVVCSKTACVSVPALLFE